MYILFLSLKASKQSIPTVTTLPIVAFILEVVQQLLFNDLIKRFSYLVYHSFQLIVASSGFEPRLSMQHIKSFPLRKKVSWSTPNLLATARIDLLSLEASFAIVVFSLTIRNSCGILKGVTSR